MLLRIMLALAAMVLAGPAFAATCGSATSAGTASAGWETYCWLDFSTYNDTTARTASGQTLSFTLTDGSIFKVTVKAASTTSTTLQGVAAPSWSGAAIGNTAFLGIPNKPVLYTINGGTVTLTLSNMSVTPPTGGTSTGQFMLVAADAESTNNGESLAFTTNGSAWAMLDTVPPISGSTYPSVTNSGTTVTESGAAGTVGSYIFGTKTPTTVTATITAGGLQGVMFAVRYASLRLNKTIVNRRLYASDQFTYTVANASNAATIASKTTSGSALTGFGDAVAIVSSGVQLKLTEIMASGSAGALTAYSSSLSCTNATSGSSTALPTNVATTSYTFGTLAYGDAVTCTFTNTPKLPSLTTTKVSTVVSDPVDGTTNPKLIPGAVLKYTITVTNLGPGPVDASTVVITDALPSTIMVKVSGTAVAFTDGSPASGLTWTYPANVTWSTQPGGGAPYTYTPVGDANGYDALVTGIRIAPTGTLAGAGGSGATSFKVEFTAVVK